MTAASGGRGQAPDGHARDALAIEAAGLTKVLRQHPGPDRGSALRVPRGSVFALLGPNGAGKTTTVRILATLTRPDGGQARVAGCDIAAQRAEVRRRISLTGQYAALDDLLTGTENLVMLGRLRGLTARAARARAAHPAGRVRPGRRGRPAGGHVLRRPAAPAGPGRQPDRRARGHLPGRADHRPGPAQPPGGVGPGHRAGQGRGHGPAHHPVPGRGRQTGRPHRGHRPRRDRGRRQPGPAQGPGLRPAPGTGHGQPGRVHPDGPRARQPGQPRRPGPAGPVGAHDGSAAHVRAVLDEVDPGRSLVRSFGVRAASLDDVFLALTGPPGQARRRRGRQRRRRTVRQREGGNAHV